MPTDCLQFSMPEDSDVDLEAFLLADDIFIQVFFYLSCYANKN